MQFDALSAATTQLSWKLDRADGSVISTRSFQLDIPYGGSGAFELAAGTYQLSIDAGGDAIGNYAFRLLDLASAELITTGTVLTRSLSPASEADTYRFAAVEGAYFYIDGLSNNTANAYWRLLDPVGRYVTDNALYNDLELVRANVTGDYTLVVDGYFTDSGLIDYSFVVRAVTIPAPQTLTLGTTYSQSIAVAGQFHQYQFAVNTETYVLFDTLASAGDINWSLQGATNLVNSRPLSLDRGGEVLKLRPGNYTLTIDGVGEQTGNFSFRLFDLASAPPITPGTPVSESLSPSNQTDLFKFNGTAGTSYYLDTRIAGSHPFVNAQWRLIDPIGRNLFVNSIFANSDVLTLPLTGQYTLAVEGNFSDTQVTDYAFNVQPLNDAVPIPLSFDTPYTGTIGVTGEVDRYSFNVASAASSEAQLHFDALTSAGNITWSLIGPLGNVVTSQLFENANNPWLRLFPGDYTLSIQGVQDNVGAYSFQVSNATSGTPLTFGSPITGTLDPGSETAIFLLPANAGDKYDFLGNTPTAGTNGWRLIDPLGQTVFSEGTQTSATDVVLNQTGTYRLMILGELNASSTKTYEYEVDFKGNSSVALPGTPMNLDALVNGNLSVGGEQDSFTFSVSTRTYIAGDALTGVADLYWTLSGPTGIVYSNLFASDNSTLGLGLEPGNYQLTLFSNSNSVTGAYSFRLLNLASASPISIGDTVTDQLSPANETNLYRFSGIAGSKIYLDSLNSAFNPLSFWSLIDPAGRVIASDRTAFDLDVLTLPLTGQYVVTVHGGFDSSTPTNYSFKIHAVSEPTPVALTFGAVNNGTFTVPGQNDRYGFSLAGDSIVTFDALNAPLDFLWRLDGPSGLGDFRTFDNEVTLELMKGDYKLVIDANVDTIGNYSFRLLNRALATSVTPGVQVNGTLALGNQMNAYSFAATAGQQFYLDSLTPSDGGSRWEILNPLGQSIISDRLFNDLGTVSANIAGEYMILVRGGSNTANGQAFQFNVQPLLVNSAVSLDIGNNYLGSIAVPGERDTYQFTLPNAVTVYFDTLNSPGSLLWQLNSSAGTNVGPVSFESDMLSLGGAQFYKLEAGNYTLTVSAYGDTTGSYAFRLLNMAAAVPLTYTTAVNASLSPGSETKLYTLSINAGERLYFDTTLQTNTNHYWGSGIHWAIAWFQVV